MQEGVYSHRRLRGAKPCLIEDRNLRGLGGFTFVFNKTQTVQSQELPSSHSLNTEPPSLA